MQSQNFRSLDGSCQSWWRPRRRRRQAALQRNSWNRNGTSLFVRSKLDSKGPSKTDVGVTWHGGGCDCFGLWRTPDESRSLKFRPRASQSSARAATGATTHGRSHAALPEEGRRHYSASATARKQRADGDLQGGGERSRQPGQKSTTHAEFLPPGGERHVLSLAFEAPSGHAPSERGATRATGRCSRSPRTAGGRGSSHPRCPPSRPGSFSRNAAASDALTLAVDDLEVALPPVPVGEGGGGHEAVVGLQPVSEGRLAQAHRGSRPGPGPGRARRRRRGGRDHGRSPDRDGPACHRSRSEAMNDAEWAVYFPFGATFGAIAS